MTTPQWRLAEWLGGFPARVIQAVSDDGSMALVGIDAPGNNEHQLWVELRDLIRAEEPIPDEPAEGSTVLVLGQACQRVSGGWLKAVFGARPYPWPEIVRQSREGTSADPVPLLTAEEHMAALLADAPELPIGQPVHFGHPDHHVTLRVTNSNGVVYIGALEADERAGRNLTLDEYKPIALALLRRWQEGRQP